MPTVRRGSSEMVEAVRAILASRGLTVPELSRRSRTRFPGSPLFHVPRNLYDALRRASFSPSVYQFYALSVVTGYRLADWMSLFGFSFDNAAAFQVVWARHHTVELDAQVYNRTAEVSWFEETSPVELGKALTPLSQWLTGGTIRKLDSLSERGVDSSFRYFKIGSRDAYAYPHLLPGSIVRVNGRTLPNSPWLRDSANYIWAIEDHGRVVCARVRALQGGRIVLCSRQLAYAPLELQLGSEAKILGYVDLEIRRLDARENAEVQPSWKRGWSFGERKLPLRPKRLGELLRGARLRSGLSFRAASEHTREIAQELGERNYFCSCGALSDLEARDQLPRHLHKLISLSAVYCLPISALTEFAGLPLDRAGQETASLRPIKRFHPEKTRAGDSGPSPLLTAVEREMQEIPFFLRKGLPSFLGLPTLPVRDLFWAGATANSLHPYLKGASVLAINRKNRSPAPAFSSPAWAQPLYVLELRDGTQLCATCAIQDGLLVIRPCTTTAFGLLRLRLHADVEVLGRVVAIARRL